MLVKKLFACSSSPWHCTDAQRVSWKDGAVAKVLAAPRFSCDDLHVMRPEVSRVFLSKRKVSRDCRNFRDSFKGLSKCKEALVHELLRLAHQI